MSNRNKLEKFAKILSYPNVYENYDPKDPGLTLDGENKLDLKGKWRTNHFKNDNEIILELACGKGDYVIQLAEMYPDKNFIGVDIKGARIWRGATTALEKNMSNVAFIRTRIEQINLFFGPEEVSEIWITFPDPFLKTSKSNRRLTAHPFQERYKQFLKKDGLMHLKTDDDFLFEFSLEVLQEREDLSILYQKNDIYSDELAFPELDFKTFYEHQHLAKGRTIKYVRWQYIN